jgi:hypothetical protein
MTTNHNTPKGGRRRFGAATLPCVIMVAWLATITHGLAPANAEPRKPARVAQMDVCVTNAGGSGSDKIARIASCCKSLGGTFATNSQGTPSCQFPDGNTWTASTDQQQSGTGPTPPLPTATAILPSGLNGIQ